MFMQDDYQDCNYYKKYVGTKKLINLEINSSVGRFLEKRKQNFS